MRIYAIADIHGKKENIEIISLVSKKLTPDLIIIAGDITSYFHWESTICQLNQLFNKDDQPALSQNTDIHPPILCIRGNSDFKRIEHPLNNAKNLNLLNTMPMVMKGVPFVGANGTIPLPFASRICLGENRLLGKLKPHINKETILVVHPPPRSICDKVGNRFSAGSRNLLDFIKTTQPRMVLCGHIHEQPGMAFVKKTLVVNCAMNKNHHGAIIDLKKGCLPQVNFLHP